MDPSTAVAMNFNQTLPKRAHPLLMGFILALVLHALLLSHLQLRRSKMKTPEPLQSRDNTPELLQFSSQPVQATNLQVLPLPNARILPPPSKGEQSKKKASPALGVGRPERKPSGVPKRKTSLVTKTVTERVYQPSVATAIPSELGKITKELRERREPSPFLEENKQSSGNSRSLSPEERQLFEKLWSQSQPTSLNPGDGLQIRLTTSKQLEESGLQLHHQQRFVSDSGSSLIWIDGEKVWILQVEKRT